MPTRSEFLGNISRIRALEDTIRSTKKYTEGIETIRKAHPAYPIQGEGFPSKVFCKYYEVYPDVEISWDMPAGIAIDLLWKDVDCIDVLFKYDYRCNKASMIVKDGDNAVKKLTKTIPKFSESLADLATGSGDAPPSAQPITNTRLADSSETRTSLKPMKIVAAINSTKRV